MSAQIGIDLGNSSFKAIRTNGNKVEAIGLVVNPVGKIVAETDAEMVKLAETMKKLMTEVGMTAGQAKITLTDSLTYSRVISMPVLSNAEVASAIHWEAEQYIPMPLEEVELSFDVLSRPDKKTGQERMDVFLLACPKKVIASVLNMCARVGLEPTIIETEMVSAARAMIAKKILMGASMICVCGASSVTLGLFKGDVLTFVYRLSGGGMAMTRAISTTLQLSMSQAETYKHSYGAAGNVLEGKLAAAMAPVLNGMIDEMKRAQSYYQQQVVGGKIEKIILCGGVALMPGLVQLLTDRLGAEVVLGDALAGMEVGAAWKRLAPVFAGAVGVVS
ncbi:hypothetical protein A2368_02525 [Candidatus Collierbacteria bacterium RIFOXYB1_FULL_49_13]|uniref:SHS2 domain-containing protein n=1 Tax=Candidatus Collierbacteria bacterium RIFOXYB1_FULL_49_13 TaxID=1817728 RepID=A0A1F5FK70_9BACT|nr:MAG: hypothetical protein A2368_02525 [Candidatus Collierbacteria bacterium RIFOXYB1_FULL_49_13]